MSYGSRPLEVIGAGSIEVGIRELCRQLGIDRVYLSRGNPVYGGSYAGAIFLAHINHPGTATAEWAGKFSTTSYEGKKLPYGTYVAATEANPILGLRNIDDLIIAN